MNNGVIIALIGLVGVCLTAWVNYQLGKIHRQINSRMDELLELTRKDSKAEGNLEGRKELKQENKK